MEHIYWVRYMKKLKSNIGWYLDNSDLTREDLMKRYNKSRNTISNWCTGNSFPSVPELFDLADLFNVFPGDLYESEQEKTDPLLDTIDELGLSRRVYLFLLRNGIKTVGYLKNTDLHQLRGLGPQGREEIESKLDIYLYKGEDENDY